ncbi:MAG: dTDP-4-dehydrorhamnose 3,5-epimerase family protein, partial [Pseudomonadota bacterium]
MQFNQTKLDGAYLIDLDRHSDERGFFARTWCQQEFREHGLNAGVAQTSISFNRHAGTLRGMHFQVEPYQETKLVRCTRGALHDVIIDLRPESPSYKQWLGVELTADNYRMLYIPAGFAHGFITLEESTEVSYMISDPYVPDSA